MTIVGSISQKGGVGKSSLSKLIAVEYARAGWRVLIADMDNSQSTCVRWNEKRITNKISPVITARKFNTVAGALECAQVYDMVVLDGAPHATHMTKEIAQVANLVIVPTSNSIEDLEPQVALAHELLRAGISKDKILFILTRVSANKLENRYVLDYLLQTGYKVAQESIPDKTVFRKAAIAGKTFTETQYSTLTGRSERVIQDVANQLKANNYAN